MTTITTTGYYVSLNPGRVLASANTLAEAEAFAATVDRPTQILPFTHTEVCF